MRTLRLALILGMPLCAAGLTLPAQADTPPADTTLYCGGIGSDESSRLLAETRQHALTLLYVSEDGHYVSEVGTRIETPKGELLVERLCGPIGQVDVPAAGRYTVKARFAGQEKSRTLQLKPGGGQRLVWRWKAD